MFTAPSPVVKKLICQLLLFGLCLCSKDDISNLLRYVFMSQTGCFGHSELYKLELSNELFNYRWSQTAFIV